MTIEEKLDLILNETKAQYGHLPEKKNWEKICRLITDGDGVATGNPDFEIDPFFNMLIQGLTDEKYIQKYTNTGENTNLTYDVATVKGLTFEGFVKAKKIKDGSKRKEILEKIAIVLISVLATALAGYLLRPSETVLKQETIILPKIQLVHDTVMLSNTPTPIIKNGSDQNDKSKLKK